MPTKPKTRKFRIKRGAATGNEARPEPSQQPPEQQTEIAPPNPAEVASSLKKPDSSEPKPAPSSDVESELDVIRQEGLTGRQLRMARRVAQKSGLAPTSDLDAVRLLRAKGIDPFQRANMLELVVPQSSDTDARQNPPAKPQQALSRIQLPQTVPSSEVAVPSAPGLNPAELREREIAKIQRDIAKRRRRKLALLFVRMAFFVFLPTLGAGHYFYNLASPMYATKSQFLIIQSEGGGGSSPFGGLLPTQFANSSDSIATQAYLQSKDAMLRLDRDEGFKQHFAAETVDPIQRIAEGATNEDVYKVYKKNIKIGYDPTEGVIKMEVIAPAPQVSKDFSEKLIVYAEERVNELSRQKREDGMRDARLGYEKALKNRRDAQERLIRLQVENGVDPQSEITAIRGQITTVQNQMIERELELAALLDNARPNQARVDGVRGDIRRLNQQLAKLDEQLNSTSGEDDTLAQKAIRVQLAQTDLAAADAIVQAAQTTMEQARTEANRQVRYLTVAVHPVAPESATYPRSFENTILSFLIFGGIYLTLSLTASVIREQVSS